LRSGYVISALLLLLLTLGGTQLAFADSVTLTIKPGQAANVSVYLNPGDSVRFSFTVASWRGTDEIGFTIVSSSGPVVLNRGRVNQYTGNYTATSGGTYYLTFDNSFSTITSKTVSVNYSVTAAPSPVLGQQGFMYGARTDKGQYDLGEAIHITVYRGSVADLCIYHLVRCEVYYLGNLVASYGHWNDSVVSPFPLTVDFTPTQAGAYTIMARYWCNGVNECSGSACQVPIIVNVIPFPSVTITTTEIQTVTVTTLPFGIPTTLPYGIPGFPVESLISGLLIGLLAVLLLRKRQKKKTLRSS
jgi:hypothetical protein